MVLRFRVLLKDTYKSMCMSILGKSKSNAIGNNVTANLRRILWYKLKTDRIEKYGIGDLISQAEVYRRGPRG